MPSSENTSSENTPSENTPSESAAGEEAAGEKAASPSSNAPLGNAPEVPARVIVVMGVSGCGKTTVGRRVAERLGCPFFEGDDLHPEANVKKMERGEPLDDADRQPWLEEIRDLAGQLAADGRAGVISCSALKRAYRDLIRVKAGDAVRFVYLEGSRAEMKKHLQERSDDHYMPDDLLESQFETLEEPTPDENVIEVHVARSVEATADEVVRQLKGEAGASIRSLSSFPTSGPMDDSYFSDFRGKVVVVTGATAGVGRAVVRRFAQEGAKVGLLARGPDGLEATKQEVERLGSQAVAVQTDVAEADQVEAAAEKIEDELGPIDIWVNNAMTSVFAEFTDIEPEEYQRVTDVCYHGSVWGTRSALKRMMPRDRGRIVLVGSALAYRGIPLQSAYCGAKHAVQGMFDSIRAELIHNDSSIDISMVQLPAVNTPQFGWVRSKLPNKAQPVPPIFQPEVAADAVAHAARTGRREMYVGYSAVQAIMGNKLVPGAGDLYLGLSGYDGQQIEGEPEEEGRPDNLFDPVPGDHGAHGAFDDRASDHSLQLWATKNRGLLAAAGAGVAGLVGAYLAARD